MTWMSYRMARAGLALVCAALAGCSGADPGPERFHVSGTVTFGGQPVPRGTVIFEPDAKAGSAGPQGLARIVDGKFDTAAEGKGVVGGAQVARINGQEAGASADSAGKPLFNEFSVEVSLSKDSASGVELAVPPGAARGLVQSLEPPP